MVPVTVLLGMPMDYYLLKFRFRHRVFDLHPPAPPGEVHGTADVLMLTQPRFVAVLGRVFPGRYYTLCYACLGFVLVGGGWLACFPVH